MNQEELQALYRLNLYQTTLYILSRLSFLGVFVYKLTTKVMYGNQLQRLNDLIDDMEELKNI